MAKFRQKNKGSLTLPVSQPRRQNPFGIIENYSPLSGASYRLYYALREAVPLIDAAVSKTVRLTGGFTVKCGSSSAQAFLDREFARLPVGGNRQGISAFIESFLEQLLTCGTALGEVVTDIYGKPAGLFNTPLEGIELRRAENGFDTDIFVLDSEGERKVRRRDLCLLSVLSPDPGALTGNSMLKGLPFVSGILLKIYSSIGENWERAGNLRYAVTYNPGSDPAGKSFAKERARQIAEQWSSAMKKGSETRDFVAVGDVRISVIGADAGVLDSEVPVRQMLEQIVAKTGLPPFMLGLSWSSTERMSAQQADMLTSELESYRRILTPVILQIARLYLESAGFRDEPEVVWDEISLQDEVEQSRALLYRAQAQKITD
jgi:hypothetical protein